MKTDVWSDKARRQWHRPPPSGVQRRRDALVGLALVGGSILGTLLTNSAGIFPLGPPPALWEQFAWIVTVSAPLMVRTSYPIVVLCTVGTLFILMQWRQVAETTAPAIALFLAIHTAGAWGRDRDVARWSRVAVIIAMFLWLAYSLVQAVFEPVPALVQGSAGPFDPIVAAVLHNIVFNLLFFGAAYHFGNMSWLAARRQAELADHAEQLRLSQQETVRGAVVAERVRIARDLHDVVAHHVAVMGVQAAAARRVLSQDPAVASDALRSVEDTARQAIGDMRGLLRVLRADAPEVPETPETSATHASVPGLDQLPELVGTAETAGLTVTHGVYGDAHPVPDGVALSAYRVVQEALTNVVKHARARTVDVRLRYRPNTLEVEVTDDGTAKRADTSSDGGYGLLGMQERVAVHDGELECGPRPDGGFRVRAVLPTGRKDAS